MIDRTIWVGTYPAAGAGTPAGLGEGVWRLRLQVDDDGAATLSGELAAATASPSFLALSPDGRRLHAAAEVAEGAVVTYDVDGDRLVERSRVAVGGDSPCHLLVHPGDRALYVSCYGSGTLAVLPLGDDGVPARPAQVLAGAGTGPRVDRQEGPHVHSAVLVDDVLLVADLGTDELRRYLVDADGSLAPDGVAHRFPPGTGPRHVAVGPTADGGTVLHVVGELTATVHALVWDASTRTAAEVQVVPASAGPVVSGTHDYPAHVVRAGDHLVVSARGPDVLARFSVRPDGTLDHRQDVAVGGSWPRHFALVGEPGAGWLVVAVQEGDAVVALPWTGDGIGEVAARVAVPRPACVLPA